MKVFPVYYNDGSGEGDRSCGIFDSPEAAKLFIKQQQYSWMYDWYSEGVLTLADLPPDEDEDDNEEDE
jgi:hypothetical protein